MISYLKKTWQNLWLAHLLARVADEQESSRIANMQSNDYARQAIARKHNAELLFRRAQKYEALHFKAADHVSDKAMFSKLFRG